MNTSELKNKQTAKKEAHMYFKRHKAGMELTDEQIKIVKRFYPFMR
jgi:hypothetical protein